MPKFFLLNLTICSCLGIHIYHFSYIPKKSTLHGIYFICTLDICPKRRKIHHFPGCFGYIQKSTVSMPKFLQSPLINIPKVSSVINFLSLSHLNHFIIFLGYLMRYHNYNMFLFLSL